jgi:molybdopterin-guanine dinucleotide biosynthesis protein A
MAHSAAISSAACLGGRRPRAISAMDYQDVRSMPDQRPVAVVLGGGLARRMGGGDKALVRLQGRPLLDHVLDRVRPQVRAVALSANGDPARFVSWGLAVLADPVPGHPGPLAGILAGMRWASRVHPGASLLLSVPTDTPLLPADLVARLLAARVGHSAAIACAASRGQFHPVVALWPVALADTLAAALATGVTGVLGFAQAHGLAVADFPADRADPFLNVNDRSDLAGAARLVS